MKIVDFGLAITASEANDGLFYSGTGSIPYTAPEIVLSRINHTQGYLGSPADIWSAGVVLYIMLVGSLVSLLFCFSFIFVHILNIVFVFFASIEPPFRRPLDRNYNDQYRRCKHYVKIRDGIFPKEVSYGAKELLSNIFKANPKQRWSTRNIMNCEWFNGPTPSTNEIDAYMMPRCLKTWNGCGFGHMAKLLERHRANMALRAQRERERELAVARANQMEQASNVITFASSVDEQEDELPQDNNGVPILASPHVVEATPDLYPEIPQVDNGDNDNDNDDDNENDAEDDEEDETITQRTRTRGTRTRNNDEMDNTSIGSDDHVEIILDEDEADEDGDRDGDGDGAEEGGNDCDVDDTATISSAVTPQTEIVAASDVMSRNGNDEYVQQSRMAEYYLNDSPMMESSSCFQASPQIQSMQPMSLSQRQRSQDNDGDHNRSDRTIHVLQRNEVGPPPAPPPATFGGDLMVPSRMAMHMRMQQQADVGTMDEDVAAANNVDQQSDDSTNEAEQRVYNGNNVENDDNGNNQDVNGNEHSESDNRSRIDENSENNVNERVHNRNESLNSGDSRVVDGNGMLSDEEGQGGVTAPVPDYIARMRQVVQRLKSAREHNNNNNNNGNDNDSGNSSEEEHTNNARENSKSENVSKSVKKGHNSNDSTEAKNESSPNSPRSEKNEKKRINDQTVKKRVNVTPTKNGKSGGKNNSSNSKAKANNRVTRKKDKKDKNDKMKRNNRNGNRHSKSHSPKPKSSYNKNKEQASMSSAAEQVEPMQRNRNYNGNDNGAPNQIPMAQVAPDDGMFYFCFFLFFCFCCFDYPCTIICFWWLTFYFTFILNRIER